MITIDTNSCIGCRRCVADCFPQALRLENERARAARERDAAKAAAAKGEQGGEN